MSSALTAQPALRACRPRRARHLREQGPKRCQSGHVAGQWPWAQSSLHSVWPSERCEGFSCSEPSTFLQAVTSAYTPKIEIFHCCNRKTPFASADAPYRAEHYGVLRSRQLQRVVLQLQVKVWSALAGGHRVSCLHPPCMSMGPETPTTWSLMGTREPGRTTIARRVALQLAPWLTRGHVHS